MKTMLNLFALLAACFAPKATAASDMTQNDRPDTIRLRQGDSEMSAAMREARSALDAFLKLAANPPANLSHFSLKVGLPLNEKDVEFVWVRPFRTDANGFSGHLVNSPRDFPGLRYGQQIGFDRENIIDFAYRDGDVLKGHYTTCVLLKRMSERQRAEVLAQNPIVCVR